MAYTNKSKNIKLYIKLFIKFVVSIFAVIGILIFYSSRLTISSYEINSSKINNSVKLVFVSDLHNTYYGENMSELIECIKGEDPDAVLIGGDMYDEKYKDNYNTRSFLKQIGEIYKCYYVSGNHEYLCGKIKPLKNEIRGYGITVLEGDTYDLQLNDEKINICGIDDYFCGRDKFFYELDKSGEKCDNGNFSVLISHRPEEIDEYLRYNFDLILSGHAHGGLWRLPGFINGVYAPDQGLFPKYAGGEYDFNNVTFIVGRGLEKVTRRIPRIFNRPEIVSINIKKK